MDAELIFSQLANFGFPVMLSWYLLIRMESKLDKLTESISALTANIAQFCLCAGNYKHLACYIT